MKNKTGVNHAYTLGIWILGVVLSTGTGAGFAATITTLDANFENPPYTLGALNGQDGWTVSFATGNVTNVQAHGGSQSLLTGAGNGGASKQLDPRPNPPNPVAPAFNIGNANDWWVQAWVNVTSGGAGARLTLVNALGGCPLISISGNGTPYFNSCTREDASQGSLGASILDQWVHLQMVHTADMGQGMVMSITGPSIDLIVNLNQYTGAGTGLPVTVQLRGDAYWDDVSAGYGPVPGAVPIPAAAWLFGSGLLGLVGVARKKKQK